MIAPREKWQSKEKIGVLGISCPTGGEKMS